MHTFLRLLGFLRPYTRGAVVSLVLAGLAMAATVAIPWLTGLAVDDIDRGDRDGLTTLVAAIAGLALVDEMRGRATPETAEQVADAMWGIVHARPDGDPVKQRVTEHHEELARLGHRRL